MTLTAYVVDDAEVDRYTARRHLQRSGEIGQVLEAENGPAFLRDLYDRVNDLPPCDLLGPLILMDINMPEMDGFETVRALRARRITEGWPENAVVVILSSSEAAHDRLRAAEDDMIQGYFVKPLTRDAVARMLELTQPGQNPTSPNST